MVYSRYIKASECEAQMLSELNKHDYQLSTKLCETFLEIYKTYWTTAESKYKLFNIGVVEIVGEVIHHA